LQDGKPHSLYECYDILHLPDDTPCPPKISDIIEICSRKLQQVIITTPNKATPNDSVLQLDQECFKPLPQQAIIATPNKATPGDSVLQLDQECFKPLPNTEELRKLRLARLDTNELSESSVLLKSCSYPCSIL
jgi:hypothetical protein